MEKNFFFFTVLIHHAFEACMSRLVTEIAEFEKPTQIENDGKRSWESRIYRLTKTPVISFGESHVRAISPV
ncbi:hypothetical protein M433DRAFT_426068 [Acidomyces richmondensis BFW]|nr:MAG: hypothetical protein FE78DRAFT_228400 [Acidomyces sp. 'richmondensis']KYG48335.1 hypothetical protein M433DRAFT_426068 [Acidomyces richmondensis BFW]